MQQDRLRWTETHVLSDADEADLAARYRAGDKAAGRRLVEGNLRGAYYVAQRYISPSYSPEDIEELQQVGAMGMVRALDRYDPAMGTRFLTYASYWIHNAIRRDFIPHRSDVRVPSRAYQGGARVVCVRTEGGELPDDSTRLEEDSDPWAAHEAAQRREVIERALAYLDPRGRLVIRRRLLSRDGYTLGDVGDEIGRTRQRVQQIQVEAEKWLRWYLATLAPHVLEGIVPADVEVEPLEITTERVGFYISNRVADGWTAAQAQREASRDLEAVEALRVGARRTG